MVLWLTVDDCRLRGAWSWKLTPVLCAFCGVLCPQEILEDLSAQVQAAGELTPRVAGSPDRSVRHTASPHC